MSPRRTPRQLVVAVLVGVLVGGGLLAVTPAGAEVTQVAATNWKKIWKKNLKPLADRRYHTKAQSDAKYATKAESAAGDAASNASTDSKLSSYYKKTESDAKYAAAGSSYSKAEIDAKLAPFVNAVAATAGGNQILSLTPADQVVRSVSLMPPANGTVIVSSSGQIETSTAGVARCSIGLTGAVDFSATQNMSGAAGDFATAAGTRGFAVTKGNLLTVNLVCDEFSGEHTMHDSALTAIFAPS